MEPGEASSTSSVSSRHGTTVQAEPGSLELSAEPRGSLAVAVAGYPSSPPGAAAPAPVPEKYALYPPSSLLKPLLPVICWESDLNILVQGGAEDKVLPVHRSLLAAGMSRFLTELFGPELGAHGDSEPVPVSPPCPEFIGRAVHALTVGVRPELTEVEFVGFIRTSAFLQSDVLDARLCEVALASWRSLTRLPDFRNPAVPAHFLERLVVMAREHRVMTTGEALEVLALWSIDQVAGGDAVLEKIVSVQDIEAAELTRLQQVNPRFVELLTPSAVFQIMRRGIDSFI
eukprot:gnl/TRDRNA2_/TRDRNA2_176047_c1_seq2.p1 gnl/TRDRNA2_/TRDRNA2_176047_c1~~gnl/TRDRNA2_/TRDRNA2_176047_c1_seq2.p1  ORF type:complete len:287 (+),score=75.63 gnl/TRDRNA2_/TRDRNA2_176047_c1_seq2:142-1002(+)